MSNWEKLAEARIQEWIHRSPQDRPRALHDGPLVPLETQLLDEALELARQASTLPDGPERRALLGRATAVETRLFIVLETAGRPLAAHRVAELLARARGRIAADSRR